MILRRRITATTRPTTTNGSTLPRTFSDGGRATVAGKQQQEDYCDDESLPRCVQRPPNRDHLTSNASNRRWRQVSSSREAAAAGGARDVSRLEPLVRFLFVFLDYTNVYLVNIYCTPTTITITPGIEKKPQTTVYAVVWAATSPRHTAQPLRRVESALAAGRARDTTRLEPLVRTNVSHVVSSSGEDFLFLLGTN